MQGNPSSKRLGSDWDSIREKDGFAVGDQVRGRAGLRLGVIRNLIEVKGGRIRARVHWPTVPFECDGVVCSPGSEQFVDLDKLSVVQRTDQQLEMFA